MMGVIASTVPTGGAFFSPTSISGLQLWHSALDVISGTEPSNNDPVGTWQDLSGNGYHLTQATSTKKPTYKTNIINTDKPGIYFDGGDSLISTTAAVSQGNTWVLICRPETGWDYIFDGNTTRQLMDDNGGPLRMFAGSSFDTSLNPTEGSDYFLFGFYNGASSYLRHNGTDTSTGNPGSNGFKDLILGARTGDSSWFIGYIFEILLYDSVLSSEQISNLETYFKDASRYGSIF